MPSSAPPRGACRLPALAASVLATATIVGATPARCAGQGSAPPSRPLLAQGAVAGDLVYPQGRGETQVNVAPHVGRTSGGGVLLVPVGIEYGLTEAWQIEAEVTGARRRGEAGGVSGVELGLRRSWMSVRGSNFHAAVGVRVGREREVGAAPDAGEAPGGADDDAPGVEVAPSLTLARDLPSLGGAHAFTQVEVGLARRAGGLASGVNGALAWNTGVLVPVRRVRLSGELTAQGALGRALGGAPGAPGQPGDGGRSVCFTPGGVWPLSPGWEVAAGVPIRLAGAAADRALVRLTFEF